MPQGLWLQVQEDGAVGPPRVGVQPRGARGPAGDAPARPGQTHAQEAEQAEGEAAWAPEAWGGTAGRLAH